MVLRKMSRKNKSLIGGGSCCMFPLGERYLKEDTFVIIIRTLFETGNVRSILEHTFVEFVQVVVIYNILKYNESIKVQGVKSPFEVLGR